jgi:endonuclease/exonuclease/phosphatase family metal-dependent hydrolase
LGKDPTHDYIAPRGEQLIDHIAIHGDLTVHGLEVLSRETPKGLEMSDHLGVLADLVTEPAE